MGFAIDRNLVFFHSFEQRTLGFWSGPVDFIGQDKMCKHRPGMKPEHLFFRVEDGYAENIGGQQIAGELDSFEIESEYLCDGLRQRGFADPG